MKLAIVGSRGFDDFPRLCQKLEHVLTKLPPITEIVSGGAKGADSLGARYAMWKKIPLKEFLPNWEVYGNSAGMIRNEQIISYADVVVAFWDGSSKGTKNSIQQTIAQKKQLFVDMYNEPYTESV